MVVVPWGFGIGFLGLRDTLGSLRSGFSMPLHLSAKSQDRGLVMMMMMMTKVQSTVLIVLNRLRYIRTQCQQMSM